MTDLTADLRRILSGSFFLRTSMIRRRTGTLRTVETTYVWDGQDRLYLSGYPGRRDWVANMAANPEVTIHTVESEPWYDIPASARVIRDRSERLPHLLSFIEHWTSRPGFPRRGFQFAIWAMRFHHRLHLPWCGPFWFARRILDHMPCVEVTFTGEPVLRPDGPPALSEQHENHP